MTKIVMIIWNLSKIVDVKASDHSRVGLFHEALMKSRITMWKMNMERRVVIRVTATYTSAQVIKKAERKVKERRKKRSNIIRKGIRCITSQDYKMPKNREENLIKKVIHLLRKIQIKVNLMKTTMKSHLIISIESQKLLKIRLLVNRKLKKR